MYPTNWLGPALRFRAQAKKNRAKDVKESWLGQVSLFSCEVSAQAAAFEELARKGGSACERASDGLRFIVNESSDGRLTHRADAELLLERIHGR